MLHWRPLSLLFPLFAGLLSLAGSARSAELPLKVEEALEAEFPGKETLTVANESEDGVTYHVVILEQGGKTIRADISAEGAFREIRTPVEWAELPAAVTEAAAKIFSVKEKGDTFRREQRASTRSGAFVPVVPPLIYFELEYIESSTQQRLFLLPDGAPVPDKQWSGSRRPDGVDDSLAERKKAMASRVKRPEEGEESVPLAELSPGITGAVQKKMKWVTLSAAHIVRSDGKFFFRLTGSGGGEELEIRVSGEGRILAVERLIETKELPEAVTAEVAKTFRYATLDRAWEVEEDGLRSYRLTLTTREGLLVVVITPEGLVKSQSIY